MPWSLLHNTGSCFLGQDGLLCQVIPFLGMAGPVCESGWGRPPCLPMLWHFLQWYKKGCRIGWSPPTQTYLRLHVSFSCKQAVCSLWNSVIPWGKHTHDSLFVWVSRPPCNLYHFILWNRSSYLMAALWGPMILNANKFYQKNNSKSKDWASLIWNLKCSNT